MDSESGRRVSDDRSGKKLLFQVQFEKTTLSGGKANVIKNEHVVITIVAWVLD